MHRYKYRYILFIQYFLFFFLTWRSFTHFAFRPCFPCLMSVSLFAVWSWICSAAGEITRQAFHLFYLIRKNNKHLFNRIINKFLCFFLINS